MFVTCFVIECFVSFEYFNPLGGEEIADCFALIVFRISCDSQCSVALPRSTVGWSTVCDYGIS